MKRRTYSDCDTEGQHPDDAATKRVRSSAASGFDRGPDESVTAVQPTGARARASLISPDGSLVMRVVDIPPNADVMFLQRLLGPDSAFPSQIRSESGCTCAMGLGNGPTPEERPFVLHVTGKTIPMVESSIARIRGLFQLSPMKRDGMLAHFCGGKSIVMATRAQSQRLGLPGPLSLTGLGPGSQPGPSPVGAPVSSRSEKMIKVPQDQVSSVMTVRTKKVLCEATGVDIDWEPPNARLQGMPAQIAQAEKMLLRVMKHCLWGVSETKVLHLLKPPPAHSDVQGGSVRLRLTPMNTLKPVEVALTSAKRTITIGKGAENDVVVADQMVSRRHCVIDLDHHRGGVYIVDLSTNGTYLNGRQLPNKSGGKVVLMHGDELLLKNPQQGHTEFGYIVNLQQI